MRKFIYLFSVLLSLLLSGRSYAAPKATLWAFWDASTIKSTLRVDHSRWDRFLASYVLTTHPSGINRVRYAQVTPADKKALKAYLHDLQLVKVRGFNKAEQKAYWINLYNALTVNAILDHFPVASIMDVKISPGLFSRGPWGAPLATVEGQMISLDDIEHRILRPIFQDPRVHYAVNCASLGCPNLIPTAFTAENTERHLEEAARSYVNHPRGVRVKEGKVIVSSIYIWFQEDFGGDDLGLLSHLQRYAQGSLKEQLKQARNISDNDYNWDLNHP